MSDVVGAQITVDQAGEILVPATPAGETVRIVNQDATHSVFLGDSSVTASGAKAGYELKAGVATDWAPVPASAEIHAIAAAGQTVRVDVLRVVAD